MVFELLAPTNSKIVIGKIMDNQTIQNLWKKVHALSIFEKLDLIKQFLEMGNVIDYTILEFESINTICHEILSKKIKSNSVNN